MPPYMGTSGSCVASTSLRALRGNFPLSALGVAYGAGLRVFEVANLKVSDADSECMTLRVEQGRGSGIAM